MSHAAPAIHSSASEAKQASRAASAAAAATEPISDWTDDGDEMGVTTDDGSGLIEGAESAERRPICRYCGTRYYISTTSCSEAPVTDGLHDPCEPAASPPAEPVPDWTDDGDETADAAYRAVFAAAEHGFETEADVVDIGRRAGAAEGASALRVEKVVDVVGSAYKGVAGRELDSDDETRISASVGSAMGSDSEDAEWRFAAAQERAEKALESDIWSDNPDDAYVTAFETIEKISGSVMTDAEMREMADAVTAAAAEREAGISRFEAILAAEREHPGTRRTARVGRKVSGDTWLTDLGWHAQSTTLMRVGGNHASREDAIAALADEHYKYTPSADPRNG
ncbi:hypothetical protein [Candidatus Poriferisodalis sp.]|uniref:hypothetical protein n=1 Tax=Candidatus Poriferisodalis sp. TaxID=3101277 RepID=UPI003C6FD723